MKSANTLWVLAGALFGGIVGIAVFLWLVNQFGAYGFAIPGVAVGIGASLKPGAPKWMAVICGLLGLVAGIFSTWKGAPFRADGSFGYFLGHLHQLPFYQHLLLVLGAAIAAWLPWRRAAG